VFKYDEETLLSRRSLMRVRKEDVDIICLHWTTGLLTTKCVQALYRRYAVAVIVTMMDMEPMTGGCHYTFGCRRFMEHCGICPQLEPNGLHDVSWMVLDRKRRCFGEIPVVVRCSSHACSDLLRQSVVFRDAAVVVNPFPVNEELFHPSDKQSAKVSLGIDPRTKVVMCGASMLDEWRKGFDLVVGALRMLRQTKNGDLNVDQVTVLVVGEGNDAAVRDICYPVVNVGFVPDQARLASLYQAADVFVCSSREDEGPMMLAQAMMSGTPVVSTPTALARDLLRGGDAGYLCAACSDTEIVLGLRSVLGSRGTEIMGRAARRIALEQLSRSVFIDTFLNVCRSAVDNRKATGRARSL